MKDCIFCKLIKDGSNLIWQNDKIAAFYDINPSAPIHILVVPKKHISNLDNLIDLKLGAELLSSIKLIAKENKLNSGYRVVINNGIDGGQIVEHLHFHLLGGKRFKELDTKRYVR